MHYPGTPVYEHTLEALRRAEAHLQQAMVVLTQAPGLVLYDEVVRLAGIAQNVRETMSYCQQQLDAQAAAAERNVGAYI